MAIDFVGLKAVYDAAKKEPNFAMNTWRRKTPCGTTHCMIGAFCDQNTSDVLTFFGASIMHQDDPMLSSIGAVARRFGLSNGEARFLFHCEHMRRKGRVPAAASLSRHAALARLRKFIYYKMHKQEMITESGRNKQLHLPRNVSGRLSVVAAQGA